MYFSEHKFAVEIGEKGHTDRNQNEESKREAKIENHSDCKFFNQFNPDGGSFDIFLEISKIKYYITQSNEGKIKEQKKQNKRTTTTTTKNCKIIMKFYVSSISVLVKHIKYFVKKYFPHFKT